MQQRKLGEKVLAGGMLLLGCLGLFVGVAAPLSGRPTPLGLIGLSAVLLLGAALSVRALFRG